MSVIKNVRFSFAVAWWGNSNVGTGFINLKEGEGHTSSGFAISSDHRFLTAWPYDLGEKYPMRCKVGLKPGFFTQMGNLLKGNSQFRICPKFVSVLEPTSFPLSQVKTVTFDNGWDDSCYSFYDADKLHKKEKNAH